MKEITPKMVLEAAHVGLRKVADHYGVSYERIRREMKKAGMVGAEDGRSDRFAPLRKVEPGRPPTSSPQSELEKARESQFLVVKGEIPVGHGGYGQCKRLCSYLNRYPLRGDTSVYVVIKSAEFMASRGPR